MERLGVFLEVLLRGRDLSFHPPGGAGLHAGERAAPWPQPPPPPCRLMEMCRAPAPRQLASTFQDRINFVHFSALLITNASLNFMSHHQTGDLTTPALCTSSHSAACGPGQEAQKPTGATLRSPRGGGGGGVYT